ncbi:MAG: discoidin domain-containing protein [Candidatus Sulfotelmatobacter sp.]
MNSATRHVVLLFSLAVCGQAQTIQVDVTPSHMRKAFVPNQTLGAGIDRISQQMVDATFVKPVIDKVLEAGWAPVTYRQNTELYTEAWHWNAKGTWSNPQGKGYFVGDSVPSEIIRYSYGYPLPHRGVTRDDGTETVGYSRLTDGDTNTYWKSNPYLSKAFTGDDDSKNPQWIFFDLANVQSVDAIRIAWADPYARRYVVQFFTGDDPIHFPNKGLWQNFPFGLITDGEGGTPTIRLASSPVPVRWVRIWMTESSNTCDTHGAGDRRNCVGYAIRELYMGTLGANGEFNDILRHTPDQDQTPTYCSSVDPWHEPTDLDRSGRTQVGFDLFYTSGYTRGLPAMIPIALIYNTPDDAAAEIKYLKNRNYAISYIEMGEEPDGHYMLPEDYGALYLQFATALHKVDPALKLGGPIFTGQNKDIEVWADAEGRTSWTGRFIDYLKAHARLSELAFFSFEHYPYDPCRYQWGSLYDEPTLVSNILQVWRDDGVPANIPLFITESNISSQDSEASVDIFGALWLADTVGAFLSAGGDAFYYYHYIPFAVNPGCNNSQATFGMFAVDGKYQITQPLAQFFASQLVNLEWLRPGNEMHEVYPAESDVRDSAGHTLVTSYAVKRPDEKWSLLIINKDQENAHRVTVKFHNADSKSEASFTGEVDIVTFGRAQYHWDPLRRVADPDGPAARATTIDGANKTIELPAASVVVLRGKIGAELR